MLSLKKRMKKLVCLFSSMLDLNVICKWMKRACKFASCLMFQYISSILHYHLSTDSYCFRPTWLTQGKSKAKPITGKRPLWTFQYMMTFRRRILRGRKTNSSKFPGKRNKKSTRNGANDYYGSDSNSQDEARRHPNRHPEKTAKKGSQKTAKECKRCGSSDLSSASGDNTSSEAGRGLFLFLWFLHKSFLPIKLKEQHYHK